MSKVTDGTLLKGQIAGRNSYSLPAELAAGAVAALAAVGVRYLLPLRPDQLPTALVVIALAFVTTFIGLRAGIVTAVLGGLLSWYFFYNPNSWSLANEAWVPVLGYSIIALVILTTSHLYRASERMHHDRELARLQADAEASKLFAREMAHRLGNTLAIVQSIARQTFGPGQGDSRKFAERLRALADANRILVEHVEMPTASVAQVIETAIGPFQAEGQSFHVECVDAAVQSQQVLLLALALHELSTNAIKHGALSVPDGSVSLAVRYVGDHLELVWKERNGPKVTQPATAGFGTRLLSHSGVTADLAYESDGVRCSMKFARAC